MRFERKFRIENLGAEEVAEWVLRHPAKFRKEFPDRYVNNIYLDTPDLQSLREKLNGAVHHVKFRIRWYGAEPFEVRNPVLESKIRVGELGEKTFRPLPGFTIHSRQTLEEYVKAQVQAPFVLEPVLLNRYLRSYYVSDSGEFRLTLDRDIEYRGVNPGFFSVLNISRDNAVIIEVKFHESLEKEWEKVRSEFPFQLSRNSKYVNGMLLTGKGL